MSTTPSTPLTPEVRAFMAANGRKSAQARQERLAHGAPPPANQFTPSKASKAAKARWARPGARAHAAEIMRQRNMARMRQMRMERAVELARRLSEQAGQKKATTTTTTL